MLKQYNAILHSLAGHARRKKQVDREWQTLYEELKELERRSDALQRVGVRKSMETDSIEAGWKAIVYALRGQRKKELEKARAAEREILNQIRQADDRRSCINREMNALEQERELLAPGAAEFKRTLAMKYEMMRRYGLLSGEILQREAQKKRAEAELERVKALWKTSDPIMDQLRRISNLLNEADNASQSDLMGGGSSGYRKHRHLAEAQSEYAHLQKMIEEFGRQMNGEAAHIDDIAMEMDGFSIEIDVIFDNVFIDRKMLQRIRSAKAEFMKVYDQMRVVQKSLMQRKNNLEEIRKRLKEEIDALVLAAE